MVQQTLTAIANFGKTVYLDGVTDVLPEQATVYGLFERDGDEIEGKSLQATFSLKTQGNESQAWIPENTTLPSADYPRHAVGTVGLKDLYASVDYTYRALRAAKSSRGAFRNLIEESLDDLLDRTTIEVERSIIGDGSGAMAQINQATGAVAANTDITVDHPGSRALAKGMTVVMWSARSGGTQQSPLDTDNTLTYATISNLDAIAGTIQFSVATSVTQDYFIFRADGATSSSRGNVMNGLRGILDHNILSTLHGIDRSAAAGKYFRSNVVNALGAGLSIRKIQNYIEEASINGGGVIDCIITSHVQRQKYMELLIPDRRYGPRDKLVNGLTQPIFLSGDKEIPWIVSRYCWDDEMMLIQKNCFKIHEDGFDWVLNNSNDGSILQRESNKHNYQTYLFNLLNLACKAPFRNSYVYNLETS